jgi:hydrogenase/urease accessory protein HupE
MKRIVALSLIPTAALAHEGDHSHGGFFGNLRHLLTEPDHLAMMATAVLLVGVLVWLRKGRSE